MANKYIVRRPIKDNNSQVIGYEILYHGENQVYGSEEPQSKNTKVNEFAVADTIYNFLMQNTEKVRGSLNFMTFTTTLLMKKVPHLFDKSELVIQIDDSVIIHPLAMHFVQMYKKEGYKIAVNEFQFAPRYLAMIDDIDYIKLNFETMSDVSLHNVVEIARSMGKQCIAMEVNSEALYQKAETMGVYGMEGAFVAAKLATKAHSSSYLQSNFFQLMVAITQEDPDLNEIVQIISMDATLTYALLRVANSVQFASRNRTTSVLQAVMKLGVGQLRQWIYLLSATNGSDEVDPFFEEFLKLSFTRASLCSELMNYTKVIPMSKGEAYLMGMFSTLQYLIDAPLEEILAQIPIADDIKAALLTKEGPCAPLLDLVLSYEAADWDKVNAIAEQMGIQANLLTNLYFDCVESAEQIWDSISNAVIEPAE